MQLTLDGRTKDQVAIERIQTFCPPEGYWGATSAMGKDSAVLMHLTKRAGVLADWHYQLTGIDPPEAVQQLRHMHPEVAWERPRMSIWRLLVEVHGLPRRQGRWCCQELKEGGGSGREVLTGIRWAESPRRQRRQMVEVCYRDSTKVYVNPIIDWSTSDVWQYIGEHNLPISTLYAEGFKRLGCVLCPMTTAKQTQREMERWPKIAEAWHRAIIRRYEEHPTEGSLKFRDGEHLWRWWLSRKAEPKASEAQCVMFQ